MNSNRNKTKQQAKSQVGAEVRPRRKKETLPKSGKAEGASPLNDVIAHDPPGERTFLATNDSSKRNKDEALRRRINLEIQSCAEEQNRQLMDEQAKRRSVEDKAGNVDPEKQGHVPQKTIQQPGQERGASEVTQPGSGEAKMQLSIGNPVRRV